MMSDGLAEVREFVKLQASILRALKRDHVEVHNWDEHDELNKIPGHGNIVVNNQQWSFRRHGSGFTIVSEHEVVIDAHRLLGSFPYGFDAWRLSTYFSSKRIDNVTYSNCVYSTDDGGVRDFIEAMNDKEDIRLVSKEGVFQMCDLYH